MGGDRAVTDRPRLGGRRWLRDAVDVDGAAGTEWRGGGVAIFACGAIAERLLRATPIAVADLVIDPIDRVASRGGRALPLHPREFALLLGLARAGGRPLDRRALLALVWGLEFDPGTNVVAVTVSRLRAKLDAGRRPLLHTGPGGYRLAAID